MALIEKLAAIADAIRSKTGKTDGLTLDEMPGEIESMAAGKDRLMDLVNGTITTFSNNDITILREYALYGCRNLVSVNIPNVTRIEGNVFKNCNKLSEVNMPKIREVWGSAFLQTGIEKIDLGQITYFIENLFYGGKIKIIVLRYDANVVPLRHTNALALTPFDTGGTGGVLLVPSAFVTAYTEATNWSVYYGKGLTRFLALEDYTLDGTTTGEIDWNKVNTLFEETSK